MIYRLDGITLKVLSYYKTLVEAEEILGIPAKTISSGVIRKSLVRGKYYFSRTVEFAPTVRIRQPRKTKRFILLLLPEMHDEMLKAIGQRNRQDVLRNIIKNWMLTENKQ